MSEFGYPLDGEQNYVASQVGAFFYCRTSGVFSAEDNLKVTITGARELTLSPGVAWVRTDTFWGKVYVNTENKSFTLPTADGVLDQILRFSVRWNKTTNVFETVMLTGTLGSTPVAPARSTTDELYDLVLYDYLNEHGETEATAAHLTDQRLNEDLCGLCADGVTRIPTSVLQAQAEGLIAYLEQELAAAEGGTLYELKRLQFTDTVVPTTAFVAEDPLTYEDFPYRAEIALTGVLATMTPEVVLGVVEAMSGIFAPVAACYAGGVYLYASEVPEAYITIPTIICWKAVG